MKIWKAGLCEYSCVDTDTCSNTSTWSEWHVDTYEGPVPAPVILQCSHDHAAPRSGAGVQAHSSTVLKRLVAHCLLPST